MLESISQLGIESKYETADGVVMEKLDFDIDKMLEELNSDEDGDGYTNLDVVYDSAVFRTTISNKIFEQEDIKYRSNALVEENFVVSESNCYNFAKKEIEDLITFLNETDIKLDDPDGFDTGTIFESLEDERVRQTITESNILNITVVDKLAVADGISIPATFKTNNVVDINKDAWYPAEDDLETTEDETVLWDECELGKLLASVVELDIEIVNGDPKFPEDETSLLKDLNGSSVTTPEADNLSKLDVVYSSDIIKQTIKEKLDENTEILKRDQAFVGGNRDNYYEKIEIELLVQFANNEGIDFNNISTSVVFDLLAKEDNRRIITESNILNITVVNKFDGVTDLEFPTDYLTTQDDPATLENEQKINVNAAKWYPADANWKNCELAKLLESVVELNITVDTNDNPVIPETDILLKSLNDENEDGKIKLDVVYESDIISKTINVKIKQDGICIRDEAYQLDENNQITDILNSDEILLLVDFVEFANIEIHEDENQVDAEHIFSILRSRTMIQTEDGLVTKGDVARKMIVTSNILNMTLVDKLALTEDLIFPKVYVLSEDDPSTTDINERVINEKLSIWYPADSSNWDDCELSRLLAGITELDMTASGNEITFSTNEIIDSLLEKTPSDELKLNVAYHSDVIAMTISNRVHNTASVTVPDLNNTIPTSGSNAKEHIIYDLTASRTIDDKIIHIEELDEMLYALLTPVADGGLGVSFASGFDIVNALSIDILVDNLNSEHSLLNSSILHYKVSQSLMEQKQATSDNDEGYSIVTQEYYINDTETTKIVYTKEYEYEGNNFLCSYIEKEEIAITIESLQLAGIDSIEDASGIGLADLILLFGDPDNTNSTLVDNIGKSAILSKIFGQVLISEKFTIGINQYCYYQAIGYFAYHDPFHYQTKVVKELDGVTDVDTLSQSDVKEIVSNFYRLIP